MRKVKMQDGSTKYSDSSRHEIGSFYENWATEKWYIIETAEQGEVEGEYGIDKVWLHTMREATVEELEAREREQAEFNDKNSEERTEDMIECLGDRFPGLDW